jgi:hypothetical protein
LVTCRDTCSIRVRFWAPSQYPVLCSTAGPSTAGKELRDAFLLKRPSPFGHTCEAPVTWCNTGSAWYPACWIGRRLHWQVEKKMAGSLRTTLPVHQFLLHWKTGPEVFNRICEDIVVGGNSVNTGSMTALGSLDAVGNQATELLLAVHPYLWSLFGDSSRFGLRKKQRLRSDLKSAQSARCRLCPSAWSSGIGAPILHCQLCGLDNRDSPIDTLVS